MYTHARDRRLAIENHGRSPEQPGGIANAAGAEMDLALTQALPGSMNYVLAGDLVAPATPSQVTGILAIVAE